MALERGSLVEPDHPSTDVIYESLGNRRRRYAVHFLKQEGRAVAVGELAAQVAAWENGKSVAELRSQERKRVYIALYQSHLASMERDGLITYDAERGVVELAPALADVDVYMEIVPKRDIPWNYFYLGLASANALLLALIWFDVEPFSVVPDLAAGAIVLVSFTLSAFVQAYYSTQMRLGDPGAPPRSEAEE